MPQKTKNKLKACSKSWTVRFAAFVPVLLAIAESTKDVLPAISTILTGWNFVILSVVVSSIVAILRIRGEE